MNLNTQSLDITCPNCSRKQAVTIGKLRTNAHSCTGCGALFEASQFDREIAKLEKSIADLGRTLGGLGKRR